MTPPRKGASWTRKARLERQREAMAEFLGWLAWGWWA